VIDPAGKDYTYAYDINAFGNGVHRLKSVAMPGAPATTVNYHYEYGLPGALTGKSYNGTRYSTFTYNADGRAIASQHANGVDRHTFSYHTHADVPIMASAPPPPSPGAECDLATGVCTLPVADDANDPELAARADAANAADAIIDALAGSYPSHIDETNPLGRETHYEFEDYRLTEVEGAATTHCAAGYRNRQYDGNGYEDRIEDFNGNVTDFNYNAQGQLLTRTEAFGTPAARTISNTWDVANNLITKTTIAGDREDTFAYAADHRIQSVTVRNLSPHGVPNQTRTTTYSYSEYPSGVLSTLVIDGPLVGSADAITYGYTAKGDLASVKNSLGHTVTYENHTGRGQPQRINGANGERTDYLYDERGRVTRVRTFRNGGQQDIVITYSPAGLRQSVTTPDGITESYSYDNSRRLTETTRTEAGGLARQVFTYDLASNLLRTEIYRGNTLHHRAYIDYDEQNRVRGRRGNHGQDIRYGYDPNDNLTYVTDSLGKVTHIEYDARNRPFRTTDTLGGITRTAYDTGDRVRQVTDPRNLITSYAYDGFGQLRSQTSPDTGTATYTWDAGGLLSSLKRADNITVSFGYDGLGRHTSTSASGHSYTYTWDACIKGTGRLCAQSGQGKNESLAYTAYGEISGREIDITGSPASFDHGYTYDNLGRLATLTYPNGVQAIYAYTKDRVTSLDVKIGNQTRVVATGVLYEPMGPAKGFAVGNGGTRINHYDTDGRLTDIITDLKLGYHFDFDASDRITGFTNFANGGWSQGFGYDDLHRLKTVTSTGLGNQAFTYDPNGNRKTHAQGGNTAYAIANTNNRLTALTGSANRSYTYTPTGHVQTITGFGGGGEIIFRNGFQVESPPVTTYGYDPFDRLTSVTGPGINASYQLGADGTRYQKTANGETTRFDYGPGGMLLSEHRQSPARWTNYLWLNGEPVGLVRDNTLYYIQTDHLGRPEVITDQTKQRAWRATLKVFDRTVITDQLGGFHLGFPGQYHDTETGHAYNIHRDYDPGTGRYLQSDPIGLAGGINTYAYGGNDPVSRIDPFGLKDYSPCETNNIMASISYESRLPYGLGLANTWANHASLLGVGARDYAYIDQDSTFAVIDSAGVSTMTSGEFGNYIAGYSGQLAGGSIGRSMMLGGGIIHNVVGSIFGGQRFDMDASSRPFINRGFLRAQNELQSGFTAGYCSCK